jgi:hypothetical protein
MPTRRAGTMQWVDVIMTSRLALYVSHKYSVTGWDVTTSRCGHVPNWPGVLADFVRRNFYVDLLPCLHGCDIGVGKPVFSNSKCFAC